MKSKNKIPWMIAASLVVMFQASVPAQDSLKRMPSITLNYYAVENTTAYITVSAKVKVEGRFKPVSGLALKMYLDQEIPDQMIDSAVTNEYGLIKAYLPTSLKKIWQTPGLHTFIASSTENDSLQAIQSELEITKTRLVLDTLSIDNLKNIKVTAYSWDDKTLMPLPGLEMKLGVKRLGGILKVTEEETYTTDSTGVIIAALTDTSIQGDSTGALTLIAQVEENDVYGNLVVTKSVPWGKASSAPTGFFDQRTLWSTRFRTPWWLLFIVYGMSIGIWATLIAVIRSLIKTVKLGKL